MTDKPSRAVEIDREMEAAGFGYQLRTAQACRALGVSHETLRKLRNDGLITPHVINKEHRYSRAEIARFRANGEK